MSSGFGGLFGLFGSAAKAQVSTSKSDAPATSMNPKYLATVSLLLKNDTAKSVSFQRITNSFRVGNTTPADYIKEVEKIFGAGDLDKVILPLTQELPEKAIAVKLAEVYKKIKK